MQCSVLSPHITDLPCLEIQHFMCLFYLKVLSVMGNGWECLLPIATVVVASSGSVLETMVFNQ